MARLVRHDIVAGPGRDRLTSAWALTSTRIVEVGWFGGGRLVATVAQEVV
jgi:hypothetical protein